MTTLRLIGPGRAGLSLAGALDAAGWEVLAPLARGDDLRGAARDVDVLVIAVQDAAVGRVAHEVAPVPTTTVVHLAGSLTLDVLRPHQERASVHPLVALPDPVLGAARLSSGAWFGVAASSAGAASTVHAMVDALDGHPVPVADAVRPMYHAAACIASNHLVALLGQAERVAAHAGLPLAAYLDLVRATVENVADLGPAGALTGPVARGDWDTVAAHRRALAPDELAAYDAMAAAAARLAGRTPPWDATGAAPPTDATRSER